MVPSCSTTEAHMKDRDCSAPGVCEEKGGGMTRLAALSFTGGKDSILAYSEAVYQGYTICALVTFGPPEAAQALKAHPLRLIKAQAKALGVPHEEIVITPPYIDCYNAAIAALREKYGIGALVTGDIMDVCERFMERAVEGTGVALIRPLWARPRSELLAAMEARGLDMVVTCVNVVKMGKEAAEELLGRRGKCALAKMRELARRTGVDAAGEHGEFHTAVLDAPFFKQWYVRLEDAEGRELAEVSDDKRAPFVPSADGQFMFLDFASATLAEK